MSAWSDGAPRLQAPAGAPPVVPPRSPGVASPRSMPERASGAVSRLRQFEGPRGYSSRAAVYLRHVAYFLVITICSAVTQYCTNGVPHASGGGKWMMLSSTVVVLGGALGTVFYANLRNEIIAKVRHYVFGISVFPGVLIAVFLRATYSFLGDDAFGGTLSLALPVVFLATVVLPSLVFIKELSGIRTLHRSRLDDQEALALWTRQDGLQR